MKIAPVDRQLVLLNEAIILDKKATYLETLVQDLNDTATAYHEQLSDSCFCHGRFRAESLGSAIIQLSCDIHGDRRNPTLQHLSAENAHQHARLLAAGCSMASPPTTPGAPT